MAELPNGFKADRKGLNITVSLTETDQFKEIVKLLAEMISDLREDIPSEAERKEHYISILANILET